MSIVTIIAIIGILICLSSLYFSQTSFNLGMIILCLGAVIVFSSIFFMETPYKDFCDSNNGIYEYSENFKTCSIPDVDGNYIVYKLLEVDDEIKLARFSDFALDVETAE